MKLLSTSKIEITEELYGPALDSLFAFNLSAFKTVTIVAVNGDEKYREENFGDEKYKSLPLAQFKRFISKLKRSDTSDKEPRTSATFGNEESSNGHNTLSCEHEEAQQAGRVNVTLNIHSLVEKLEIKTPHKDGRSKQMKLERLVTKSILKAVMAAGDTISNEKLLTKILQKHYKTLLHDLAAQQKRRKCSQSDGSLPHREPASQCESKCRSGICPAFHLPQMSESGKRHHCTLPQDYGKSGKWHPPIFFSTAPECRHRVDPPKNPLANRY